jgi:hypothetical protein
MRSQDQDRPSRRRRAERLGASVLGIALVLAVIGGTWSVLGSADDESPGATRDFYADASTTREYVDSEARQRNLDELRNLPDPQGTAIRSVVGPEMSEDDLQALNREVNLLCSGSDVNAAEAAAHLQQNQGLRAEVAAAVIEAVGEC